MLCRQIDHQNGKSLNILYLQHFVYANIFESITQIEG